MNVKYNTSFPHSRHTDRSLHCRHQTVTTYFVQLPTNAQLFHKLSHSYVFRHYRVVLRQLVINTLTSHTSISNAAVRKTVYNQDVPHRFHAISPITVVEITTV
jgi:hypothetical protein